MKDPVISRFAAACGATGAIDMRVDLAEGGMLAEGSVPMPFTLIGRDDACDVTLTDAEVNPRHAWLQVVGGRVFAVDLGSRTGLGWHDGETGSGWLDVGTPVRIGPFQLRLRSPVTTHPASFPRGYNPLQSDPEATRSRPAVALEFRNGKRAKDRWSVNRLITLVGRAPECKIHLTADDVAGYHCGLVLCPDGLWVVDLSGRGVVVNGERMRVSPLRPGAELWIGRFLIGVQYPAVGHTPAVGRPGTITPPNPLPGLLLSNPPGRLGNVTTVTAQPAEDEVELGVIQPLDPAAGLPSSHIMADAFRLWATSTGTGGPVSHPILVSGSGPTPPVIPIPPARAATPPPEPRGAPVESTADSIVVPLLRELGDLHGQMFAHFQQSLVLMVQLFGCLRRDQLPAMQRELAQIQDLNAELAQLQGEVARRAAEVTGPPSGIRTPTPRISHPNQTPLPDPLPHRPLPPDVTALHAWVADRINTLQKERQTRWQSLVGMFSGKIA